MELASAEEVWAMPMCWKSQPMQTFATPAWNQNMKWGEALRPHYETAKKMLGVARNPKLWKADHVLKQMADEMRMGHTFRATDVGAYFGEAGVTVPDPYFGGEGPTGQDANTAADAWWDAVTMRKTHCLRIICILQKRKGQI